jgi:hypothetical protein
MDGQGLLGGGASSPATSVRPGTSGSYKRKRSGVEFESSPGSGVEGEEDDGERRRQPGVKRACNECRQQKVSHKGPKSEDAPLLNARKTAMAIAIERSIDVLG